MHEQEKYPSGSFGEVDVKTELGVQEIYGRVGEMLVNNEGERQQKEKGNLQPPLQSCYL